MPDSSYLEFFIKFSSNVTGGEEDRGSIPGRDSPRSLKQVMTAPLRNAWQQV